MGTSVSRASAEPDLFKRAASYRMASERVDGDDIEAVFDASERLLGAAREQRRPAVLEAMTYRYRGHSVADAGTAYRTKDEIAERRGRDPIARVRATLAERGVEETELEAAKQRAQETIAAAVEFADADAEPALDRLAAGMYAPTSDLQFARMKPGSPYGEEELVYAGGLGA
jgi:pyruvate dehydrogenase E1 component alpha subunit